MTESTQARIAILDVVDPTLWQAEVPGYVVYSYANAPTLAPGADVALQVPLDDDRQGQATFARIRDELKASRPTPRTLRLVQHPREIVEGKGKVVPLPRPSQAELKEAARARALTSPRLLSMAEVTATDYVEKIPLFQGEKATAILYAGAHLIVGRPKIGKSWLLLQMGLAVAEGSHFLGMRCVRGASSVLMICAEDDKARIKGRLNALGIVRAPENCFVLTFDDFRELAQKRSKVGETFPQFLDAMLTEHKFRLVIVDTETTCRQTWCGEAASGDDARRITDTDYNQTREFDALALKHDCVIGLVNHASKRKGEWTDIHELINRTNTALAGASGSLVLADMPDADPMDTSRRERVLGARGRDMTDDILLCVKQETELPIFVNLGSYQQVVQTNAEQAVLEALEEITVEEKVDGYISLSDVADVCGKSRAAVQSSLNRLLRKQGGAIWKTYRVDMKRGRSGGVRLVKR